MFNSIKDAEAFFTPVENNKIHQPKIPVKQKGS